MWTRWGAARGGAALEAWWCVVAMWCGLGPRGKCMLGLALRDGEAHPATGAGGPGLPGKWLD